jgi:hypothetical protein
MVPGPREFLACLFERSRRAQMAFAGRGCVCGLRISAGERPTEAAAAANAASLCSRLWHHYARTVAGSLAPRGRPGGSEGRTGDGPRKTAVGRSPKMLQSPPVWRFIENPDTKKETIMREMFSGPMITVAIAGAVIGVVSLSVVGTQAQVRPLPAPCWCRPPRPR